MVYCLQTIPEAFPPAGARGRRRWVARSEGRRTCSLLDCQQPAERRSSDPFSLPQNANPRETARRKEEPPGYAGVARQEQAAAGKCYPAGAFSVGRPAAADTDAQAVQAQRVSEHTGAGDRPARRGPPPYMSPRFASIASGTSLASSSPGTVRTGSTIGRRNATADLASAPCFN